MPNHPRQRALVQVIYFGFYRSSSRKDSLCNPHRDVGQRQLHTTVCKATCARLNRQKDLDEVQANRSPLIATIKNQCWLNPFENWGIEVTRGESGNVNLMRHPARDDATAERRARAPCPK